MAYSFENFHLKKIITDFEISNTSINEYLYITKQSENIYNIRYNSSCINKENYFSLGLIKSIYYNSDIDRIICFFPPKSIDLHTYAKKCLYEECYIEELIDGISINLF